MDKDLKSKTLGELEEIVLSLGQKKFHAEYVFQFIHGRNAEAIGEITPLSKEFRRWLAEEGYYISKLSISQKLIDKDGTIKYQFVLEDGNYIESVLLKDGGRKTLCISTQVGCAMDCMFCATGGMGFKRNLSAGEIVDQVNIVAADVGRISNIVYMGMGEPLLNYEAVMKSVCILNHPKGKNIGIRHITISTCGIIPGIERLAEEEIQSRLAVSLNAADDKIRSELMNVNKKYPLGQLLRAIRQYQSRTGRRVTFEYVMIKGVNDSAEQARGLIRLVDGISCNINLIEHNPHPNCSLEGSSSGQINKFATILKDAGIETTVRFRMGRGIYAACGQLGAGRLKR